MSAEDNDLGGQSKSNDTPYSASPFAGARYASTTSAWLSRPSHQAASPSSPATQNAPHASSPQVRDLTGDDLELAASDLQTLTNTTSILRIHVALDELPFAFLDSLHAHLQTEAYLREVHLCIQSSLRSALQTILGNLGLERGFTATMREWAGLETRLRWYLLVSSATMGEGAGYQEVDLMGAIRGLEKGHAGLEDVVARVERAGASSQAVAHGHQDDSMEDVEMMDMDEVL